MIINILRFVEFSREMPSLLRDIAAVVVDIEGTTTPIAFVKDELFPYIRVHVRSYLEKTFDSEETQNDLKCLRQQAEHDKADGMEITLPAGVERDREEVIETVVQNVLEQMDLDRKTTALKQLQGHVMRSGYYSGEIKGKVYDDVPRILKRLTDNGIKVYTYSSGSIYAQKLLFGHSTHGNLLDLFSDQFDTTIGAKVESDSYGRLSKAISQPPEKILFLTDIPKEAIAAEAGGIKVCLVVRDGNAPLSDADKKSFPVIYSFDELFSV